MKIFFILGFVSIAALARASECPDLTKYICKGDDGEYEMDFNQQTVGEYQQYDVPLLNVGGIKSVVANNQKDGVETNYSLAHCEKQKLIVEEYQVYETLSLLGKYTFSTNKKGDLQYLVYLKLTNGENSEETNEKIKCRLRK